MSNYLDIPSPEDTADSTGIHNALAAGHRTLKFRESCAMFSGINLDNYPGMDLCFDGNVPGRAQLEPLVLARPAAVRNQGHEDR